MVSKQSDKLKSDDHSGWHGLNADAVQHEREALVEWMLATDSKCNWSSMISKELKEYKQEDEYLDFVFVYAWAAMRGVKEATIMMVRDEDEIEVMHGVKGEFCEGLDDVATGDGQYDDVCINIIWWAPWRHCDIFRDKGAVQLELNEDAANTSTPVIHTRRTRPRSRSQPIKRKSYEMEYDPNFPLNDGDTSTHQNRKRKRLNASKQKLVEQLMGATMKALMPQILMQADSIDAASSNDLDFDLMMATQLQEYGEYVKANEKRKDIERLKKIEKEDNDVSEDREMEERERKRIWRQMKRTENRDSDDSDDSDMVPNDVDGGVKKKRAASAKPSQWPVSLYMNHCLRNGGPETELSKLCSGINKGGTKYVQSVLKAMQWQEKRFTIASNPQQGIGEWCSEKGFKFTNLQKGWIKALDLNEEDKKKAKRMKVNHSALLSDGLKEKLRE